ncbi:cold shock domain-containing protein [Halomonas sp. H33-56]|uniref:cold-shock protein n=1 Tax=Halomonas sp. H33-56 TaxID=2950873 RepID=UPI0032DE9C6A
MKGTVKWFSADKGYGFVTGEDGKDRYINAQSVVGPTLPKNGSTVQFESYQGKKGLAGKNVTIMTQGSTQESSGRVNCSSCHKEIIPRIITGPPTIRGAYGWTPVPKKSICPFCGSTFKTFTNASDVIGWIIMAIIVIFLLGVFFV